MGTERASGMRRRIATRIRLIRRHRSYTSQELAKLLGVHSRSIQVWHAAGLQPIDERSKPYLFKGEVVKAFLRKLRKKCSCSLGPGQFYCPRCKSARFSRPEIVSLGPTKREIGGGKMIVSWTGICIVCGCKLNRFAVVSCEDCTDGKATMEGQ
jgi:hypothetical protein